MLRASYHLQYLLSIPKKPIIRNVNSKYQKKKKKERFRLNPFDLLPDENLLEDVDNAIVLRAIWLISYRAKTCERLMMHK